jgi:hypothetical protein
LLLAGVAGDHLFGGPVHTVGKEHGPSQALSEELLKGGGIEVKLQSPAAVALYELVAD